MTIEVVIILIGIVQIGITIFILRHIIKRRLVTISTSYEKLVETSNKANELNNKYSELKKQLIPLSDIQNLVVQALSVQDTLRTEKGRSAITKIELETIESRLRELEEIERELEASEEEARDELRVLKEREDFLKQKNEELKLKIQQSKKDFEDLLLELNISEEVKDKFRKIQRELERVEDQILDLLIKVSEGNQQHFNLKRRYDALDIEYAQLYEKILGD
jgi:chromosome segregation ATPase